MKRYAVLNAPDFRLQAALRHSPHLPGHPAALVDSQGKKSRIAELNAAARAFRVEAGMTSTQATARCPALALLSPNPGLERSAQEALLQSAEMISPFLEATAPGLVTVEWPLEKQVDKAALATHVLEPLQRLGLRVQLGIADTPFLAGLVSQFAEPIRFITNPSTFLGPLPIETLQPPGEMGALLHAWGIHTVAELTSLPMTQVCARLGPEAVDLWERATGGRPRPLKLIKPREFFSEAADLENPVEMLEPLLFLLRRFLDQISTRLANVFLVAGKLRLVLRFENNPPYQRIFTIPQPTRDVDLLFRMLHTHLENFTAESPLIGLELAAKPVRPHAEQFGLLEKGLRDPHQLAETLARLEALLGSERVGTPELDASLHPDAFHLKPYDPNAGSSRVSEAPPLIGVPWLRFRPPIPARVKLQDVQPSYLTSSRFSGPIHEVRGPWRLEGNWWENRTWTREEWDASTDEGIYRLVHIPQGWFVDGIY